MDTCTQNFRVGTEWIARENGNHPNFHIIGGDFGNSANKTWGPHGMSRFPGYAVRIVPRPSRSRIWTPGYAGSSGNRRRNSSLPGTSPSPKRNSTHATGGAALCSAPSSWHPSAPPSETRGNSINASSSRRHSRITRCGKTGPSTGTSFPDVSAFV